MNIPLIKPSDAKWWFLCTQRVWLDIKGDVDLYSIEGDFEQLVIEVVRLEHEQAVRQRLCCNFA
jgi:hypothetical protein